MICRSPVTSAALCPRRRGTTCNDPVDEPLQEALDQAGGEIAPMRNWPGIALTISLGLTLAVIPAGSQTRAFRGSRAAEERKSVV